MHMEKMHYGLTPFNAQYFSVGLSQTKLHTFPISSLSKLTELFKVVAEQYVLTWIPK